MRRVNILDKVTLTRDRFIYYGMVGRETDIKHYRE